MKPRRIDQILSQYGYCARREAPYWLKAKRVTDCNGDPIRSVSTKRSPTELLIDAKPIDYPEGLLVMLHKPTGYVCSHNPQEGPTVFDLLPFQWMMRNPKPMSVGRLDKDTSGLLLITDDGKLVHRWTSPRHLVPKVYALTVDKPLEPDLIAVFAAGELLLAGEQKPCLPAELKIKNDFAADLTLREGRFHQVRRMFAYFGYTVQTLHRSQIGQFQLGALQPGNYQSLTLATAMSN